MARRRIVKRAHDWKGKKIFIGALIFFVGLLRYLDIEWSKILMVLGALIVLAGLSKK